MNQQTPQYIISVSRRSPKVIKTNVGTFSKVELAKALDITPSTLNCRVRRHGWDSPKILWGRGEFRGNLKDQGSAEWKELGRRSKKTEDKRSAKMQTMKLGTYEQGGFNGRQGN